MSHGTVKSSSKDSSLIKSYRGIPTNGLVDQPDEVDSVAFVKENLPSSWYTYQPPVFWIRIKNIAQHNELHDDYTWCGKWLWFVPSVELDTRFLQVAEFLRDGLLGDAVKVPPYDPDDRDNSNPSNIKVIVIYTKDFRDQADVLRIGQVIRGLGATGVISYKPDIFTLSEKHMNEDNRLPKRIYQLIPNNSELILTNDGEDLKLAIQMIEESLSKL